MNHDTWLERAEIYALDALEEAERAEFESHLASGCCHCEAHIRETPRPSRSCPALSRRSRPHRPSGAT